MIKSAVFLWTGWLILSEALTGNLVHSTHYASVLFSCFVLARLVIRLGTL